MHSLEQAHASRHAWPQVRRPAPGLQGTLGTSPALALEHCRRRLAGRRGAPTTENPIRRGTLGTRGKRHNRIAQGGNTA